MVFSLSTLCPPLFDRVRAEFHCDILNTMKKYIGLFGLLFFVLGMAGQESSAIKGVSWRVVADLELSGSLKTGTDRTMVNYAFSMTQYMTMARDNGDYLVADASMPHCSGEYSLNGGEPRVWSGGRVVPLEPRIYYVLRDHGRCLVSLAIMERDWPEDLPRLALPRSSKAHFLEGADAYRRGVTAGSHHIEFNESELFRTGPFVLPVDWSWSKMSRNGEEQHRLKGDLRFERIEQK